MAGNEKQVRTIKIEHGDEFFHTQGQKGGVVGALTGRKYALSDPEVGAKARARSLAVRRQNKERNAK